MKKGMCITYNVEDGLYVNVTNRCSNRCEFCIRDNGDGAYGSDSLWLMREPTVDEILESIYSSNPESFSEVVFCGYGEPTFRLKEIREVALALKVKYPGVKIRVNTNGQSDLILGIDTAPLFKDAFDSVSISLNASNADSYEKICHPQYGKESFSSILKFAKNVNKYVQNVAFSVVRETLSESELRLCEKIAKDTGVNLRVRSYIGDKTFSQ